MPDEHSSDYATSVLRVLSGMLESHPETVRPAIDRLRQQIANASTDQSSNTSYLFALENAFAALTGDEQATLKRFEEKIALLQSTEGTAADEMERRMLRNNNLEVPDLVRLAGPTKAETLLKQVFSLEIDSVDFHDEQTKTLARKVALEMGDRLSFAPWELAGTLDSGPLFELLSRRFGGTLNDRANPGSVNQQAMAYYLLSLVIHGRFDDAVAWALKLGKDTAVGQGTPNVTVNDALTELATKGYANEVYGFFDHLLAAHPTLPYWQSDMDAAVLAGKDDDALAKVKKASELPNLKPALKKELHREYGDALLAADHVVEALPILREAAAAAEHEALDGSLSDENASTTAASTISRLAAIALLTGDHVLLNAQLDAFVRVAKAYPGITDNAGTTTDLTLRDLFLAAKRGPELERLLAADLSQQVRAEAVERTKKSDFSADAALSTRRGRTRDILCALVDLYYRESRFADIVSLLDQAQDWGAPDIAGVFNFGKCSSWPYLGYEAARALQRTGHADAALRVVNACLEQDAGSDPTYALLLDLLPPDKAEARLNELFQTDQFEERPLIWRATLQFNQGHLDDAEKSARQAIGIDPSDGDEGRGDRLRAYAVLADILERKGDADQAGQLRKAVEAIRLSEDADRVHQAGLLTRAIGMYEQALHDFERAYCIQSRLAIQLVSLGKTDEALSHYERAYELMPESFGRVESHCFGCERAFAGEQAQAVARRVFKRLAEKQPNNPQVHYLLGYLLTEEQREAEAAREYREAVRLDPNYLNAWSQLASTTDKQADRDQAALQLLRLDPLHRHTSPDLDKVGDLRALWSATEVATRALPPAQKDVYPLAASKNVLEQERQQHPPGQPSQEEISSGHLFDGLPTGQVDEHATPRSVLVSNGVILNALLLLQKQGAADGSE